MKYAADLDCIDLHIDDTGSLQRLKPPPLTVAKSNTVVQLLPTALSFWEKLGLGPRSGKKDVTAFVFFESRGQATQTHIINWLKKVSEVYSVRLPHSAVCHPINMPYRQDN